MSRRDRRREQQVQLVTEQARSDFRAGRVPSAASLQAQAVEIAQELARDHPGDPRYAQAVASAQYELASMRTEAGQPRLAIAALEDSEERYRSVTGQPGVPDTRPLIADVRMRRALGLAAWGRGATAVTTAASAVRDYELLAAGSVAGSYQQDLARVLAGNAKILARYGDPDMAVASADRALRTYLSGAGPGQFAVPQGSVPYLITAASVAAIIHAREGRIGISLTPALLVLQWAGLTPQHAALSETGARLHQMSPEQLAAAGQQVTAALRDIAAAIAAGTFGPATISQVAGSADVTAIAGVITMLEEFAGRQLPPAPGPYDAWPTLAGALARAGLGETAAVITRPAADVAIVTPYDRCPADLAATLARVLAEAALPLLETTPADALRIGLEAHYLFAAASDPQSLAMRYELASYGPAWARVLLACSAFAGGRGEPQLAVDLASWAAGAAQQLMPFTMLDDGLKPLVRDCIEQHGRALIAAGEPQAGEEALATATRVWAQLQGEP